MILDGLLFRYLDVWESGVNQISTKLMTPKEFVNGKVIVTADWTREIFYVGFRFGSSGVSIRNEWLLLRCRHVTSKGEEYLTTFQDFRHLPVFSSLVVEDFWRSARAVPLANGITAQPIMANDRQKVEESRKTLRH
ncbi:unnamed protein product [Rhizophagus irregularis]|nr:unnamed protein product [Rhizophagus irregularis]